MSFSSPEYLLALLILPLLVGAYVWRERQRQRSAAAWANPALVPQTIDLPGRSLRYTWLPVKFDNNRAWNDEHNTAVLELALVANEQRTTWRISMEQR